MSLRPMIFVIEDDLETGNLIERFLKSKNYQVKTFTNAEDSIVELQKNPSACDVLITDFSLPNMTGMDLIKTLLAKGIKAPIILMTGHKTADLAAKATAAGAYDFITKPLRFPQLQTSVERAIYLNQVHEENSTLRAVVSAKQEPSFEGLIGKSPKFLRALDLAKRIATRSSSVLITGESGTGKEVFAQAIHQMGKGNKKPFVAINCSAIPENLLESELFGHAKGSFTGAIEKRIGLFEEAEGGTLFLDEIGDLSFPLQVKLLRVLQEKKIRRVGENQNRPINCRIISATHKDLSVEILEGRFREDLFFRLNVIPIEIPPLRERIEDVMPLANLFLKKYALQNLSPAKTFSKEVIKFILENKWRGNVRELENAIERAVVLCDEAEISLESFTSITSGQKSANQNFSDVPPTEGDIFSVSCQSRLLTLEELVRKYIEYAVNKNGGARDKTAKAIGVDRKTLYKKLTPENPTMQSLT
jgi:two-component system response regulator HydG